MVFLGYGVQGGCPKWNNVLDHQIWQGSPKKIRHSHISNPPSSHQGPSILQSSHLNGVAQGCAWSSWQGFPLPSFSQLEGVGKTGVLSFWPWNMFKNRCVYRTWMNMVHFQFVQCPLTPSHPCLCHGILPDWYLEPYFLPGTQQISVLKRLQWHFCVSISVCLVAFWSYVMWSSLIHLLKISLNQISMCPSTDRSTEEPDLIRPKPIKSNPASADPSLLLHRLLEEFS